MAIKLHPSIAVHAGEWLRIELVEAHGIAVSVLAAHLGVSRQALSNVLHGRSALSADMALRFEKAFGIPADTMLRVQAAHDLAAARSRADELDRPELA